MKYRDKYLMAVDNRYQLYIMERESGALIKKIELAGEGTKPVHRYAKTFLITPKNEVVTSFDGSNRLVLYKLGKGVGRRDVISWHRSDIEAVAVSSKGGVYATGGSDGKVFLYKTLHAEPVCAFEPRGEYISFLAFSPNERFLASSSFDRTTRIYDLNRHMEVSAFGSAETVEHSAFFDDGRRLYAVTRDGSSIVFDIEQNRIQSEEKHFDNWPTTVEISPNGKVAVVGTKGNTIYLVKLHENRKLCSYETKNNGITQISLEGDGLDISGIDGGLIRYETGLHKETFEEGMAGKDYHKAKNALDQNPLLYLHPLVEAFDASWSDVLKEAIRRLSVGECDAGCSIVQPFMDHPGRVEEFNFYLAQKEVFVTFIRYVETGRYKEAYALAEKNSYLKRISQYEEMEKLWERSFRAARKSIETESGNVRQVREMLRPFSHIASKEKLIRLLVENGHVFKEAEVMVRTMRFDAFFKLVDSYPFLTEAGIYKKVMQVGENLYQKMIGCEESREFDRYYSIARVLGVFPSYAESCREGIEYNRVRERFFRSVREEDIITAFNLLEHHGALMLEPEYEMLLADFNAQCAEAEKRAGHGAEPLELKEILSAYITIPYWRERIAGVLKEGYINELRSMGSDEGSLEIEKGVREYVRFFGKDDVLINYMRSVGLETWMENTVEGEGSEGYRQSGFPNTIRV